MDKKQLKKEIEKYLKKWSRNDIFGYKKTDECLDKLFTKIYPLNKDINEILAKIFALNSAYYTQIPSPCFIKLAQRIKNIADFENRLKVGDTELVSEISKIIEYKNGLGKIKRHTPYSFATKYMSFHEPKKYPIFDSNVEEALIYFRMRSNVAEKLTFRNSDLRKYEKFKQIVTDFQRVFKLEGYCFRDIDKYLYLRGKEIKKEKIKKKKNK